MTKKEWLNGNDPTAMLMLMLARGKGSDRKLRMFAVACLQHMCSSYSVEEVDAARMALAERTAESGQLDGAEIASITPPDEEDDFVSAPWIAHHALMGCFDLNAVEGTCRTLRSVDGFIYTIIMGEDDPKEEPEAFAGYQQERGALAAILRDIFGNPFRPVTLDPAWLTSTVVALAEGIYADRAFERMPILADALQDAGCENADILSHCRDANLAHVRGCWVIDLLLGKV